MKIIFVILALLSATIDAHHHFHCMLPPDAKDCLSEWPIVVNETLIQECMFISFRERKGFECGLECYTNATKMLVMGKIDKTYATSSMVSFLKPEFASWKPILTKGIEKCVNDANNQTYMQEMEDRKNNMTHHHHENREHCNIRSGFFLACVGGQLYQNCPSEMWSNTTRCNHYKAIVQECNMFIAPPPHHHHHHDHDHHHHHGPHSSSEEDTEKKMNEQEKSDN